MKSKDVMHYTSPFPAETTGNFENLQKEYFRNVFNVKEAAENLWDLEENGLLPAEMVDSIGESSEESDDEDEDELEEDEYE